MLAHSGHGVSFLYAAPLIYEEKPVARLELEDEFDAVLEAVEAAEMSVQKEVFTSHALSTALQSSLLLHLCCHGANAKRREDAYVLLEGHNPGQRHFANGYGIRCTATALQALCSAGTGIKVIFVSACHSEPIGRTFVEAGVDHVVAIKRSTGIRDDAAREFCATL